MVSDPEARSSPLRKRIKIMMGEDPRTHTLSLLNQTIPSVEDPFWHEISESSVLFYTLMKPIHSEPPLDGEVIVLSRPMAKKTIVDVN